MHKFRAFPAVIRIGCILAASCLAVSADAKWIPLFDGKTLSGWVNEQGGPVTRGWAAEAGAIHRIGRSGSIYTAKHYLNFELEFEWKIAAGGNSGVKYRLHKTPDSGWLGPEYQIIDDGAHKDGRNEGTSAGALYLLKAPGPAKSLRPVGEFNQARIVARGALLEHWLNGVKILEIDMSSDEWRRKLAAAKYSKSPGAQEWFARRSGPIMLQDHGNEVWFRNIRIREID